MAIKFLAEKLIRNIPDFPRVGDFSKDITPVFLDPAAYQEVIQKMSLEAKNQGAEALVGIESGGFLMAAPIALNLRLPLIVARKLSKIPGEKLSEEYATRQGTNTIEIHRDAIRAGQRIYVVDDLLATGATAAATARIIECLNGKVSGFGFFIELTHLHGRMNLLRYPINSLIEY
jgi:adenine phosphoribosyltransferase